MITDRAGHNTTVKELGKEVHIMDVKEEKQSMSRRGFIKGAAIGAGSLALAGFAVKETKAAPVPKK